MISSLTHTPTFNLHKSFLVIGMLYLWIMTSSLSGLSNTSSIVIPPRVKPTTVVVLSVDDIVVWFDALLLNDVRSIGWAFCLDLFSSSRSFRLFFSASFSLLLFSVGSVIVDSCGLGTYILVRW